MWLAILLILFMIGGVAGLIAWIKPIIGRRRTRAKPRGDQESELPPIQSRLALIFADDLRGKHSTLQEAFSLLRTEESDRDAPQMDRAREASDGSQLPSIISEVETHREQDPDLPSVPCSRCGRPLTNRESVNLGMGPVCASKMECDSVVDA
jgi:Family of unknown function (DUF6011)